MTVVSDVLSVLETIAPKSYKMDWDNVGLLCGDPSQEVHKILIALDPFEDAAQEAIQVGADLLITHHPLIFSPLQSITAESSVGRTLSCLLRHGISAVNAHTNLDCAPGGVNDVLASVLGLSEVSVVDPMGTDTNGQAWGLLRKGIVPEQTLSRFLAHVKQSLSCPGLRFVAGGKAVHHVAVGGGACASELKEAVRAGCDTFVTSDVKYNQFWDAHDLGLNLIDAGHFYTENPVCFYLQDKISDAFPEIPVFISKEHRDCMKFFV